MYVSITNRFCLEISILYPNWILSPMVYLVWCVLGDWEWGCVLL